MSSGSCLIFRFQHLTYRDSRIHPRRAVLEFFRAIFLHKFPLYRVLCTSYIPKKKCHIAAETVLYTSAKVTLLTFALCLQREVASLPPCI
jgi:hypothetical protein